MVPILRPRKKRCTEMKVMDFETRGKLSDKLRNLRQGMNRRMPCSDQKSTLGRPERERGGGRQNVTWSGAKDVVQR